MQEQAPPPPPDAATGVPPRILVKGRHGYFMVIDNDLYVSLALRTYGEHGETEWNFLKRFFKPGQTVLDVGAHLGTFTVPFARAVGPTGRVIAFEPQPFIHECLQATILLNKLPNVTLHRACVGNQTGELEIAEPDYGAMGNFSGLPFGEVGYKGTHFTEKRIRAPVMRLDDVIGDGRCDFIKIDVEGMELEALQGTENLLKRCRPVIYMENNRRDKSPPLMRFLMERGYRLWWHTGSFFNPDNFAGNMQNIYGLMHNIDQICLPQEMGDSLIPAGLIPATDPEAHILTPDGVIQSKPV